MRMRLQEVSVVGVAATLVLTLLVACDRRDATSPDELEAIRFAQQSGPKKLSGELCSPSAGGFTIESTNPYFPMTVGRQWILTGEEGDESIKLQITVLNQTRVIRGVTTRVIEEREWVDDELLEVSWNYYAQASDGTICYFGEEVDIYEDGGISHEGRWCADTPGNEPGIFMPAEPAPGMKFQMEVAPGVAEDQGHIVGSGTVTVPFGTFTETIRVRETNPLDGDVGYKIWAAGVGLISDDPVQLVDVNQTSGVPEPPFLSEQICGV